MIYLKDVNNVAVTMQWLHGEKQIDQERCHLVYLQPISI